MEVSDLSSDLAYRDLKRIFEEHGEPFLSLNQCQIYLRVGNMLRFRIPEEQDHAGERLKTRDIEDMMAHARKAMARFTLDSTPVTVIVPPDVLR